MKNVKTILAVLIISGITMAMTTRTDMPIEISSKTSIIETSKTAAVVSLKKYYKANDGSYVYVRQIKNKIYAFAEHLDGSAASVIVGVMNGNSIKANYYYVPKGEAKGKGKVSFTIGSGGDLTLKSDTSNAFNIQSMAAMNLPTRLPSVRRAWYRGNTPNNLTGRWNAQNVGESYLLETDGQIIMYTEGYRKGNNARPQLSTVFIGSRSGNSINGSYVDLPLGHTASKGEAGFSVEGTHKLVVNKKYYPGVKHERVLADTREILTNTVKRPPLKTRRPVKTKGGNHQ